jgi:predicted DNA-binding transcriptional regulator AlpA
VSAQPSGYPQIHALTTAPREPASPRELRPSRDHLYRRPSALCGSADDTSQHEEISLASAAEQPAVESRPSEHATRSGDSLMDIEGIREFFKLGRTAAYELTHRPEFPEPVVVSSRCYRWWASEVAAYATTLRREPIRRGRRRTPMPQGNPTGSPRRIIGTVRTAQPRRPAR